MKSTHLLSNVLLTCVRKEALPSTSQLVAVGCVHICFFCSFFPHFLQSLFRCRHQCFSVQIYLLLLLLFFFPPLFLVFSSFHVLSLIDILYRFFISIHIWSLSIVKYSLSLSLGLFSFLDTSCLPKYGCIGVLRGIG